jgi:hypothetical protein
MSAVVSETVSLFVHTLAPRDECAVHPKREQRTPAFRLPPTIVKLPPHAPQRMSPLMRCPLQPAYVGHRERDGSGHSRPPKGGSK